MELDVKFYDKYYMSDSIENGRIVKNFLQTLIKNIFSLSYEHWKCHFEYTGEHSIPITYGERNLYSCISSAINSITPIHLSEWAFNSSQYETVENNRRVDIWCLNKNSKTGMPINYFIEIKQGNYNLSKKSRPRFEKTVEEKIVSLLSQVQSLKDIEPGWGESVYLGLAIIHGYCIHGKEYYSDKNILENIKLLLDSHSECQLMFSTWSLPEEINLIWDEQYKCHFITIAGIVISRKREK